MEDEETPPAHVDPVERGRHLILRSTTSHVLWEVDRKPLAAVAGQGRIAVAERCDDRPARLPVLAGWQNKPDERRALRRYVARQLSNRLHQPVHVLPVCIVVIWDTAAPRSEYCGVPGRRGEGPARDSSPAEQQRPTVAPLSDTAGTLRSRDGSRQRRSRARDPERFRLQQRLGAPPARWLAERVRRRVHLSRARRPPVRDEQGRGSCRPGLSAACVSSPA